VPDGCTNFIQAGDIYLNKAFKHNIQKRYNEWIRPAGNRKGPPRRTVVEWIIKAWEDVPEELVKKSFIACGLTTTDEQFDQIACFKDKRPCSGGAEKLRQAIAEEEKELREFYEISDEPIPILISDDETNIDDEEFRDEEEVVNCQAGNPRSDDDEEDVDITIHILAEEEADEEELVSDHEKNIDDEELRDEEEAVNCQAGNPSVIRSDDDEEDVDITIHILAEEEADEEELVLQSVNRSDDDVEAMAEEDG